MATTATNHAALAMGQVATRFPRFNHSFFPTTFFLVTTDWCYFSLCIILTHIKLQISYFDA